MRFWCVGLLIAATAEPAAPLRLNARQGQSSAEEQAVRQVFDRAGEAYRLRDTVMYRALVTDDFIRVTPNGQLHSRKEWLEAVAAPGEERQSGANDRVIIRVYGPAAVLTYRALPVPGTYHSRVFSKEGSQWKMVFGQSTNVHSVTTPGIATLPARASSSSAETGAARDALAAFRAIRQAGATRDVARWDQLTAPEFMVIRNDGSITTRAERIATLKQPGADAAPGPRDEDVRVIMKGDVAVIISTFDNDRSVKVLAKKAGRWQQVLQQLSPIS